MTIIYIHLTLFFIFVILVGEQAGEWKATSKWQETSRICVELLQMQAILWFEGAHGDHELPKKFHEILFSPTLQIQRYFSFSFFLFSYPSLLPTLHPYPTSLFLNSAAHKTIYVRDLVAGCLK